MTICPKMLVTRKIALGATVEPIGLLHAILREFGKAVRGRPLNLHPLKQATTIIWAREPLLENDNVGRTPLANRLATVT